MQDHQDFAVFDNEDGNGEINFLVNVGHGF